ncbi:asparagine synthase-related protein [Asticcacaulis sp.]|uniref:asparagine synthetase B family protein n=1 Tax=Asticcacaulis sp. TaxID=1872648 RepID=UPI002631B496|nr:asparagine synthase-related protein [Asticcacaulis sp.]
MTAIAGLWQHDGADHITDRIGRMGAALAAYGPDRAGTSDIAAGLALTCRQSHITPSDMIDHQPLWDGERRICVVADARIDNAAELASGFGWAAGEAERCSDAALILAAYRRWGPDCVGRLSGDFAFALWDDREQRLLLARDHYGGRPLFFAHRPGLFAFASMPKGLFALGEFSNTLDAVELGAYVALLPQEGTRTFYRDLSRVPPGHYLLVQGDRRRLVQYWPGAFKEPDRPGDYREYVEEFGRLYTQAVRACLRVRPGAGIGSHLSAGYDSASVTALAARELLAQSKGLTAFTGAPRDGFTGPYPAARVIDESGVAGDVARRFSNIDHRIIRAGPDGPLRDLERTLPYLETPFFNICNLGWARVIEETAARSGIKVLLTGAMGNLTVSFHGQPHLARLFRQGRWWQLAALARGMRREGVGWRMLAALALGPSLPDWIRRLRHRKGPGVFAYTALSPAFASAMDMDGLAVARGLNLSYVRRFNDSRAGRLFTLRLADPGVYHHASLAEHGLDIRDPTVDRRLVDFCLTIPEGFFIRDGRRASMLRDAMAGLLPDSMLNRRIRGVQAADWYEKMVVSRDGIAAELAQLRSSPLASRVLDLDRLCRLVADLPDPATPPDQIAAERFTSPDGDMAYRQALLRGLSVGRFIRMVEGGNG